MKIGSIDINNPVTLAPMDDVTNRAFRLICKRFGADIVYTEFASSEALIRDVQKAIIKIALTDEERPVGVQILGNNEEAMMKATQIAESYKPDFIDINCGCWVKRHVARYEGSGLLRDLPRFEKVVAATVKSTKLPVTVKTRLGWDHTDIVILDVAKMVEQAGAQALTVHCRTRCQGYKGKAEWQWLEHIKKRISIPLIGNGDIVTPDDAKAMFELGCDGVMIGRGALANPWIFKQTKHFLETGEYLPEPTLEEKILVCIEHLKLSVKFKGLGDGIIPFRKYYSGYFRGIPHVAKLRSDLMQMVEFDQIVDRLHQFLAQNKEQEHAISRC